MARPKRFYYICNPNLPVATKKRHLHSMGVRRALVYSLQGGVARFIGSCRYVIALPHKKSVVAVDLSMAKKLSSLDLNLVYVHDVTQFHTESFPRMAEEVTSILNRSDEFWSPPAGISRGKVSDKVDTVNIEL